MRTTFFLVAALWAVVACPQTLDEMVADCDNCHGKGGVSPRGSVPTIAGISAFAHEDYLFVYADEARPCAETAYLDCECGDGPAPTDMCKVAAALSEEQIQALAAHYASLPFKPADQPFDAAKAAAGAKLHAANCEKCHSDNGANAADDASILAGQWMEYLAQSFAEYRSGEREQPKKMKEKLGALSDEDVDALVHFYASQR